MKKEKIFKKNLLLAYIIILLASTNYTNGQTALFADTPVSDSGTNNSIGSANTSRNVAIDNNGNIFVAYSTGTEVRIAKSTNNGQSFLPSILISRTVNVEPELAVNNEGIVYVAWVSNSQINLSISNDNGSTFSTPESFDNISSNRIHMSTYENNVYLTDQSGNNLYSNNNNGVGGFNIISTGRSMVYADVLTDQNGIVYLPMDDPNLILFESTNQGTSLIETNLNPPGQVYYSSYALSDGPCGTFIFVGGGNLFPSNTLGYKINVRNGETTEITLGNNSITSEGRTLYADNKGTLIDGYRADNGDLMISISTNQGTTFNTPILVANGETHNIARSPTTDNISVVYEKNGQIFLSVYDNILKNIKIIEPTPSLSLCSLDSFDISFTLSGIFNPNTVFAATLSDENGDFSNAIEVGSIITNQSGTINCTLPSGLVSSSLYRLQIESSDECIQSEYIALEIDQAEITGQSSICVGDSIQLTGSGIPSSSSPWQTSNNNIASIDNQGNITGFTSGSVDITYTTVNQCSNTFTIDVFDVPQAIEETTLKACEEDNGFSSFNLQNANIDIVSDPSLFDFSYFETNNDAINNESPITNFSNYENEVANIDEVWVRIKNQNDCISISKINLIVSTSIEFSIITNDNSDNNSILINLLNGTQDQFEYSLLDSQGNILIDFQNNLFFQNLPPAIYIVKVRDKLGCITKQQEVSLLKFPLFFTPNNDNINDTWTLKGFSSIFYPVSEIIIYNRFGKVMAKLPRENPEWNGYYHNKKAPSSDYWFSVRLIDIYGNIRVEKGHFSLLRR